MAGYRKPPAPDLLRQVAELALAVPQVVSHRVARMAKANPLSGVHDQQEWLVMITEKQVAFAQAWMAMATEAAYVQQQWLLACAQWWWHPRPPGRHAPRKFARHMGRAALRIAQGGIAPIHQRAVANARRLSRRRR
jgi:hypothetical protein